MSSSLQHKVLYSLELSVVLHTFVCLANQLFVPSSATAFSFFLQRTVDLGHGHLTRLGRATFMQLELLEVLHLNDNHFKRLDKRVFQPMRALKSLTLEGNPWLCDCRLQVRKNLRGKGREGEDCENRSGKGDL